MMSGGCCQEIPEGDERVFGVVFHWYYAVIYSLVHRVSLENHDVRKAVRETFIRMWLQRDQLPEYYCANEYSNINLI